MHFAADLIEARLIRRYKRFLSEMELGDGSRVTAHCPNPGSMMGLAEPGSRCWLSHHTGGTRKLAYGWELVEARNSLVGINTVRANAIVAERLCAGRIPGLPCTTVEREVKVGAKSRLDFRLTDEDGRLTYVEVKSVTLSRQTGLAEFPDAKTARGAKHLMELVELVWFGHRAALLFLVQRGDCDRVDVAADIDPNYAATLDKVRAMGVDVLAFACRVSPQAIEIDRPIPLIQPVNWPDSEQPGPSAADLRRKRSRRIKPR
jgi:sugar fermentation stimulation protein A